MDANSVLRSWFRKTLLTPVRVAILTGKNHQALNTPASSSSYDDHIYHDGQHSSNQL